MVTILFNRFSALLQKSVILFINILLSPLYFDKITIFCNKAIKFVDF